MPEDHDFMGEALIEARRAQQRGEVPVGSVFVYEGRIIARGHNLRETAQDPTAHAELIALRKAAARLGSWRMVGVSCYVTLEPCPMCAGALVNARVERVVWGCADPKAGAVETLFKLGQDDRLNHRFEAVPGIRADESSSLLKEFFAGLRARRRGC